jgi:hypothetical protein
LAAFSQGISYRINRDMVLFRTGKGPATGAGAPGIFLALFGPKMKNPYLINSGKSFFPFGSQ